MFFSDSKIDSIIVWPNRSESGTPMTRLKTDPIAPAINPVMAPSPDCTGYTGDRFMSIFAAIAPPSSTQKQQQTFPRFTIGIADNRPSVIPPISAGTTLLGFSYIVGSSTLIQGQRDAPDGDGCECSSNDSYEAGYDINRACHSGQSSGHSPRRQGV